MKADVTYVGPYADTLDDGRPLAPGEVVKGVDLELPHNAWLVDEGRLLVHEGSESGDKLTGKELEARAAELDIEGRSDMSADEKRAAIAAKEAEAAAGAADEETQS